MSHEIKIGQFCRSVIYESDESVRISSTTIRLFLLKRFLINASVVIDNSVFQSLTVVVFVAAHLIGNITKKTALKIFIKTGIS